LRLRPGPWRKLAEPAGLDLPEIGVEPCDKPAGVSADAVTSPRDNGSASVQGLGARVLVGLSVALLSGCGATKADGAANPSLMRSRGGRAFHPGDVSCPVEAKVGGALDCAFTGPEGVP